MSSRSPSGVASLRARFEQQGEDTPPPSRGRSPAGSVTSNSSRPLSKVRTSFVAVEPSGHMASEFGSTYLDGVNEAVSGDGVGTSKSAVASLDSEATDKPKMNGNKIYPVDTAKPAINVTDDQSPAKTEAATETKPDKPIAAATDVTASILPADPKDEGAVSSGAALTDETPGLGSILKGSPFEDQEAKKAGISKSSKPVAAAAALQSLKVQNKAPSSGAVNGKLKEARTMKPALSHPVQAKAPIASITTGSPKDAPVVKPAPEPKQKAAPPAPIETQPATTSLTPIVPETSEAKQQETVISAPRTPTSAIATGKQPLSKSLAPVKTASPKAVPSKEAKKDANKDIKQPANRPSGGSKPQTAPVAKPVAPASISTARPVKKPDTAASTFTKPKPKSPTRPVRLPVSATAPTAASAAKLDGAPPSMSDRKPVNTASITRASGISNSKAPGPKVSRVSLPAGSKPHEKVKATKSRMSMAGAPTPSGGFLERMMRPTQSSAQKTHEKVEPKTPPKKTHSIRPKRMSEGSEKSKSEHGDTKSEPPKEQVAGASQPSAEAIEATSTNGAKENANELASTTSAEIIVQ